MAAAVERMEAQARRTVAGMVKRQARYYARHPESLRLVHPSLAKPADSLDARAVTAAGWEALEAEINKPRRHFGFGGEVPSINAKAVILLGRAMRRAENYRRAA